MKVKWKKRTASAKIILAVRIAASLCVTVFAALQLLGVWEKAMHAAVPLLGLALLMQSAEEWKQHRGVAIFELCAALFIFACTIVVWFVR